MSSRMYAAAKRKVVYCDDCRAYLASPLMSFTGSLYCIRCGTENKV